MPHSVRRHLRLEVEEYDLEIRRFIPGYDTMLSVAADAVASVNPGVVVDLGAGTGALSEALLLKGSIGRVELVDVDPEMLEQARSRLARYGERTAYTVGRFEDELPAATAYAASLSLHHIPTIEEKAALFARIYDALPEGGVLVNADANMPEEELPRKRMFRKWADHMVRSGISEERVWLHFEQWAEEDTYLPVDEEVAHLRRIGFEVERTWSRGPISVVVATRPGS